MKKLVLMFFVMFVLAPAVFGAGENVSTGITDVWASEYSGAYYPYKATDGIMGVPNSWNSPWGLGAWPHWWRIDLGATYCINETIFNAMGTEYLRSANLTVIQYSDDNVTWTNLTTFEVPKPTTANEEYRKQYEGAEHRYWGIEFVSIWDWIAEGNLAESEIVFVNSSSCVVPDGDAPYFTGFVQNSVSYKDGDKIQVNITFNDGGDGLASGKFFNVSGSESDVELIAISGTPSSLVVVRNFTARGFGGNQYNVSFNASDVLGNTNSSYVYVLNVSVTPLTISDVNCTSNPEGDVSESYNSSGDLTPSFSLTTGRAATCGISSSNDSFVSGELTGGTSHLVSLSYSDMLSLGSGVVFVNCTDSDGISLFQDWNVFTAPSDTGESFSVSQNAEVVVYNNTHLVWNRSVCVSNFFASDKSFDIPSLNGWGLIGGSDPLVVSGQGRNCSVFSNVTTRQMFDEILNLSAVTVNGTDSNHFLLGNLIDPPHAFVKDGRAECSYNTVVDSVTDVSDFTLYLIGSGTFTVETVLYANKVIKDLNCELNIKSSGGKIIIG